MKFLKNILMMLCVIWICCNGHSASAAQVPAAGQAPVPAQAAGPEVPGFNRDAFNRLKIALGGNADSPFYIITVARMGSDALSNDKIASIKAGINSVIADLNSRNPDSVGIVIFNEYFFGRAPVGVQAVYNFGKTFSSISSRYVFLINHVVCDHMDAIRNIWLHNGQCILASKGKFRSLSNSRDTTVLEAFGAELTSGLAEPFSRIDSAISDDKAFTNEKSEFFATNMSTFWHNRIPVARYHKCAYVNECDEEIKKGASYLFGNCGVIRDELVYDLIDKSEAKIADAIVENFAVQICADHQYGLGCAWGRNFQIMQSNTHESTPITNFANLLYDNLDASQDDSIYRLRLHKLEPIHKRLLATIARRTVTCPYFVHVDAKNVDRNYSGRYSCVFYRTYDTDKQHYDEDKLTIPMPLPGKVGFVDFFNEAVYSSSGREDLIVEIYEIR